MNEIIRNGIVILFLMINGYLDWKKHEISLASILIFGVAGIGFSLGTSCSHWGELLGGTSVGIFVMAIAFLTKEAIGFGDGLLLVVTGVWLGFWETLRLLVTGLILCTVIMGVLVLCKAVSKEERIPLVPFLLLSFVGRLFI